MVSRIDCTNKWKPITAERRSQHSPSKLTQGCKVLPQLITKTTATANNLVRREVNQQHHSFKQWFSQNFSSQNQAIKIAGIKLKIRQVAATLHDSLSTSSSSGVSIIFSYLSTLKTIFFKYLVLAWLLCKIYRISSTQHSSWRDPSDK